MQWKLCMELKFLAVSKYRAHSSQRSAAQERAVNTYYRGAHRVLTLQ